MRDGVVVVPAKTAGRSSRKPAVRAGRRADLLGLVAYAAFTALFFWRVVGLGLVPAGYDLLIYFYPYKAYVAELLRHGQLPLWNPLVYMGVPLLANIQIGLFYPLNALFYLLPTVDALRYSIVLHTFLAAVFTYLFARASLGLSPGGAWLAGAIFAFGGFIGARVGHLNVLHSAVWLPLLLLCLEEAAKRRSLRVVALGAVVYAVQILAGHTQEVYCSGLVLGLFALYLAALGPPCRGREEESSLGAPQTPPGAAHWTRLLTRPFTAETGGDTPWTRALWPFGAVAGMAAGAATLAGFQLLPALELAGESYRSGGVPYSQAVTYSVSLPRILESILPLYGRVPYIEINGYVAAAALPLLPAALVWKRGPSHRWFFAGLALLALLLALGGWTPLYGRLLRWVPGFDLFRAPGRWLYVYSLSVALLAGIGLDALARRRETSELMRWLGRYGLGLAGGVAILVALWLWLGSQRLEPEYPDPRVILTWGLFVTAGMAASLILCSRPGSTVKVGLVALVLLDLYLAKEPMEYNLPVASSLYTARPPFSALLSADRSYRMLSLAGEQYELPDEVALRAALPAYIAESEADVQLRFTRLQRLIPPDVGMVFGISSVDGSDGGMLPTRRFVELKRALLGSVDAQPDLTIRDEAARKIPSSRTLGALGVRYLLIDRDATDYDQGWDVVEGLDGGPQKLLRNSLALPRAYVVHAIQTVGQESQALEAVTGLDLSRVVVLNDGVQFQQPTEPGRDTVGFIRDDPDEVEMDVSLEQSGFLVLSDSYYPGWRAYVDGQEVKLLRANYAVRAVQLPAGNHRVRFAFEPLSLKLGLALSALGLVAMAVLLRPRRPIDHETHETRESSN